MSFAQLFKNLSLHFKGRVGVGMVLSPLQNSWCLTKIRNQILGIKAINKMIVWMMHGSIFQLGWDRFCPAIVFNIKRSCLAVVRKAATVPLT
jgi:hypothetical protein